MARPGPMGRRSMGSRERQENGDGVPGESPGDLREEGSLGGGGTDCGAGPTGEGRREPEWSWEGDGSRYRLEGRRPSLAIIVGWDRPLATYFVQVWDVPDGAEDHEEGELLLWGGTAWGELTEVDELERALSPFAELPRGL